MNPFVLETIPDLRLQVTTGSPRAVDVLPAPSEKVVRILVLDDPAVVSERLSPLVHRVGARALVARHSEEALRLIRGRPPEAVVFDLGRAARSEFSLILRVRIHAPKCEVILLTTHACPELREKAIRHGADHFFDATTELHHVAAVAASLVRVANQSAGSEPRRTAG